jgi:curved DNA-binding protein CbpA
MKTLYDLLGALPDDDADGLRAAFRKAAKANHPDFNPENPEASERFRKIVRANAILSDGQQRAAYDRLLEVARRQQSRKPKRSSMVRRLAADAAASAVVSVVLIGGYLLYRPFDKLPLASAPVTESSARKAAQAPTVKAAELSEAHGQVEQHRQIEQHDQAAQHHQAEQHDKLEVAGADLKPDISPRDVKEPAEPDGIAPAVSTGVAPASASPALGFGTKDAQYYRERGIQAYRSGDLYVALVNFDLAINLDPNLPDSYIDRGIVFHRLGDLKRAFSDVTEAKRIEALNRNKTPAVASAPPR